MTAFDSVLIANRGEIACRIIRTVRSMGLRSVAVFSDADRNALHVELADTAIRIGPAPASQSYLSIEAIISAAERSGAGAIHPGYGFLSENAELAQACAAAGIVFVGPGIDALRLMGDKIRAKNHVAAGGVPVIPGISEPGLDDERLTTAAESLGFPLLVKPSAGGGGKGMYLVEARAQLPAALAAARRVAGAAFGDDTLFLERYLSVPRHIEVQLLADSHSAVVHLGERECSLQRRHQKVIEEAPSPLLSPQSRVRIGEAACEVARSVGYVGAGTVEFLVSNEAPDEFYFMEMNTRLQVEHPVTELVTGIDLVEWQLRIAAGEPLTLLQNEIHQNGHAVEARLYAEDPQSGFLPSTGRVLALREAAGPGIRVDSALVEGLEIATDYDPMLAKVIAWGEDRATALRRLDDALAETMVLGLATNLGFLRQLLAEPEVVDGRLDTGLIERMLGPDSEGPPDVPQPQGTGQPTTAEAALLAAALLRHLERVEVPAAGSSWASNPGWRLGGVAPARYEFSLGQGGAVAAPGVAVTVSRAASAGEREAFSVALEGSATRVVRLRLDPGPASAEIGIEVDGALHRFIAARDGDTLWLGSRGFAQYYTSIGRAERLSRNLNSLGRPAGALSPELRAPMPGTVVLVEASTGDTVVTGQALVTLEAMKMEHHLLAPHDGIVTIAVALGGLVKRNELVATVTPAKEPES